MAFASNSKDEQEVTALNQYWYSQHTIDVLVKEVQLRATKCAFLSCPSLYFSLTDEELKKNSKVFEFDKRWDSDPGFVFYDFNRPDLIPLSLWEAFDFVVVDPPYITKEVWTKYAEAVKLILQKGGKVLFTSVVENHTMLEEAMGEDFPLMVPRFRPSIPHLTYQYHCFLNYPTDSLDVENPELPPEDPKVIAARNMCNDMRESQAAFKSQMVNRDRENEQAIPKLPAQQGTGNDTAMKWTRIPEGLTEYANGASAPPTDEGPQDFGPKYNALMARREKMEVYKKKIDAVMKVCDAFLKVAPGKAMNPEQEESTKADLLKQRDELLDEMNGVVEFLAAADVTDKAELCPMMTEAVTELGKAHELTVPQYRELSADCTRKYKSKVFNRQKDLLQQMKAAKKEHLAAAAN